MRNRNQKLLCWTFKFQQYSLDVQNRSGKQNLLPEMLSQLVLRTAACLVGSSARFGQMSGYMQDVLHWLTYLQRIVYRVSALIRRCIEGLAPPYLRELCCSTVIIQHRISLRSSAQVELLVLRTRTVIRQRRAFSVAGPTVRMAWNGLSVALCLTPVAHSALFLSGLNTTLFDRGWVGALLSRLS